MRNLNSKKQKVNLYKFPKKLNELRISYCRIKNIFIFTQFIIFCKLIKNPIMSNVKYSGVACYNVNVKLGRSLFSEKTTYLILETNHQPNYYAKANFPPNKHQSSWRFFILLKNHINCFQDVVLKKAYQINESLKTEMEIMPGHLNFHKKNYSCIRINLSNKELLGTVIKELETIGLVFLKDKKVANFETETFFKRYTELVEIQDNVYKDSRIPGHYFFPIKNIIEFDEFEKGMERIKHSCNFHMFDSFLSFMFVDKGKGQNFIGIFSNECDESRFDELKKNIKIIFDS